MDRMGRNDISEELDIPSKGYPQAMPFRKIKKIEKHIAALFLFYLCEKGYLRDMRQSKKFIRNVYTSEFKPEFMQVDESLNAKDFPTLCFILIIYLEKKLLLKMIGIDSDTLRFHQQNVEVFLEIFQKNVLKKNCLENGILGANTPEKNGNDRKVKSTKHISRKFIDQRFAFKLVEKFGNQVDNLKKIVNHCKTCNTNFPSEVELKAHFSTDQHKIRYIYQKSRKDLVETKLQIQLMVLNPSGANIANLRIEPLYPNVRDQTEEHQVVYVSGKDKVAGTLQFNILNCYDEGVALVNVLKIHKGFEIQSMSEQTENDSLFVMPCILPKLLQRGASIQISAKLSTSSVGTNEFFVFFKIFKSKQFSFIMKKLYVVVESDFTSFEPVQPFVPTLRSEPSEVKFEITAKKLVRTRTPRKKRSSVGKSGQSHLENYVMPNGLANLLNNGLRPYHGMTPTEAGLRGRILDMIETGLCVENYKEYLSLMLFIEHHQMSVDILKYRLVDVPLHADRNTSFVALNVPGLAEKRPSVLKYDSIMISVKGREDIEYEGRVQKVEDTRVLLKFNTKFMEIFIPNMKVDVRFEFSLRPHNLMHKALEVMVKRGLIPYICFPSHYGIFPVKPVEIRWINRLVQENERQREAVKRIVMGTSRPAPYLLFGPPGTGKTVTIVEAILQILKVKDDAKVLVTAPSNAAVDVISSRILKSLPPSQLMRIYSPCREWSQIPEIIKGSCNYDSRAGNFEIPEGSDILKYKVVAVTMVTAGRLIEKNVPQGHFSHIFIDECAQGLEAEALISVSGLLGSDSPKSPPNSLLVLSGDPLQLGPVLRSPFAKKLGLEKSLLERLMTSVDLYQRDEGNNYNPDVLTKLVKNFRSHPAILDLPNRLFYQGELMPSGERGITHSACNWELLPKKGVPLIFHGVEGKEERDQNSPSYFNTSEIHQVVRYLKEILDSKFSGAKIPQSEIGIISPYRRQVEKIRASISKNQIGKDVSVASVEEFQGQERRVIIISTVRSDPQRINLDRIFRLGFLREPKRFNVAVTRAKSLLIIIGNPNILQGDPCWGEQLKYCIKLGCYTGVPFKLDESFSDDDEEDDDDEDNDGDDDIPKPLRNPPSNADFDVNSVIAKLEKLSVKANVVSAVTKMIDPPWESHE